MPAESEFDLAVQLIELSKARREREQKQKQQQAEIDELCAAASTST